MPPADPVARSNVQWSIAIPNNLGGLKDGLNGLDAWLQSHRVDTETENRAHLVFDEIVTNVIRHAYGDDQTHVIDAHLRLSGGDLTLSFRDDGKPFDPRSVSAPKPPGSLTQASVGGRGLMLVRSVASHIDYERTKDGHNHLTVTLPRR